MSLEINRSHVLQNKNESICWLLFIVAYLFLGVLLQNPELTSSIFLLKEGFLKYMENSSSVIAMLGAFAAIASSIATYLAFKVASSSRDIAKNALGFQYQNSIKESIGLITSTLVSTKIITVNPTEKIQVDNVRYSLSLKRTDWIFAAQEVMNIINLVEALAVDLDHKKLLMERYGRMLEIKLSPSCHGGKGSIFTSGKPNDSYIARKFTGKTQEIRDEDLFVVYLFTEQYESYIVGNGQYPVNDICCYFGCLSKLNLS